jgi:hypothetical protein
MGIVLFQSWCWTFCFPHYSSTGRQMETEVRKHVVTGLGFDHVNPSSAENEQL